MTTTQPDTLTQLIDHHAGITPPPREGCGSRLAPEAPEYVTIQQAADLIDTKAWPIMTLVDAGKVRAIQYDGPALVIRDDVERCRAVDLRG